MEKKGFKKVHANSMAVDRSYQRKVDRSRVKRIKEYFNPDAMRPLIVNYRESDNKYYIIDGQHTFYAGCEMGIVEFDCITKHGLTIQDEAILFRELNNPKTHKAMTSREYTRAGVLAGDPMSLSIYKMVENLGREMEIRDDVRGVKCIKSLTMIYEKQGEDSLAEILNIYNTVYGRFKIEEVILKGLAMFYDKYHGTMDKARLLEKLDGISPTTLKKMALDKFRKTTQKEVCQIIIDQYNNRLRNENKLPDIL